MSQAEPNATQADLHLELEAKLREQRAEWVQRLDRIQGDRRRNTPLEADFEEQANQRENDETLDALDARGQQELAAIDSALARMQSGSYGTCVKCGEDIPPARLRAYPEAAACIGCVEATPSSG